MSESTKTEPDEPAIPMEDDAEKLKFIHGQIMKDEPEADKIHPPTVKLPQGPKVKPPACYIILLGADRVGKEKLMDRVCFCFTFHLSSSEFIVCLFVCFIFIYLFLFFWFVILV